MEYVNATSFTRFARNYLADFEIYVARAMDYKNITLDIYLRVKR